MNRCHARFTRLLAATIASFVTVPAQGQVLLVSNQGNNTVGKYSATTGAAINPAFINSSQGQPFGLLVDGNNHLFVSYLNNNAVRLFDATTGAVINSAFINGQGLSQPDLMALDGSNHLFVANINNNTVGQYDATTGATINSAFVNGQGLSAPAGLLLDGKNHLFAAGINTVGEYDATTGATINSGFIIAPRSVFTGLALDATANHLFVTDSQGGTVGEYDATTGATINSNFILVTFAAGLALDGNNHLFVVGGSTVGEFNATTGAAINRNFITGLSSPYDLRFVSPVPEPSSLLLVAGAGVTAAGMWRRRRARMASVEA